MKNDVRKSDFAAASPQKSQWKRGYSAPAKASIGDPLGMHHFLDSYRAKGDLKSIRKAVFSIRDKYMGKNSTSKVLEGGKEHIAYMLYRMPATHAAMGRVLDHIKEMLPSFAPKTILDLGSGPGGSLVAALEKFPSLEKAIGLERNEEFVLLSKECFSFFDESRATILMKTLDEVLPDETYDCVIASYSFGELLPEIQEKWFSWAKKNAKLFILVEPGTPQGWETMLDIREKAIALENRLLAPCPHAKTCPMKSEGRTWCHEAARLPRTFIHRYMKEGVVGYEDEKFCYLGVLFDETVECMPPSCRIVHTPKHRAGHTILQLCTKRGTLEERIVSRRHKDLFGRVKRARWGDSFPDKESV
jgi:ribosomal protein RSM22 (predicted rRNA methylase)